MDSIIIALALISVCLLISFVWRTSKNRAKQSNKMREGRTYEFKWYEIGKGNPFGKRILDVRPFTTTMTSTTSDPRIATSFVELRKDDGKGFVGKAPIDSVSVQCDLSYPHNGKSIDGVCYKSDRMEVKWDVYHYAEHFYFVRSWTGTLELKAKTKVKSDVIEITEVEYASDTYDGKHAIEDVHFLIKSHLLGQVYPHYIPSNIENDPMQMAIYSFSKFGNQAFYATRETILDVTVQVPPEDQQ